METLALSELALTVLRFRAKSWPLKVNEDNLPAFRELVDSGIMVRNDDDFAFTAEGWAHREVLIREAGERIERERFEPPDGASSLSETAKDLLRRRLAGDREVTAANLSHYRELAAARIMMPIHSFIGGTESAFHFTYWGWKRRFELAEMNSEK